MGNGAMKAKKQLINNYMNVICDYRFYAEDMVHPSAQAVDYLWERFCDFALPEEERQTLLDNIKACRSRQHRPMAR